MKSFLFNSGDSLSLAVLECLRKTCELYGDHFILVQYLPYCWDLASLCRRKVSPNLEGGLLGALAVIHSVIPLLSDSILMKVSFLFLVYCRRKCLAYYFIFFASRTSVFLPFFYLLLSPFPSFKSH